GGQVTTEFWDDPPISRCGRRPWGPVVADRPLEAPRCRWSHL
ncbi:MAG: hypothetical protein AVDCRST_MAG60-2, partial [uncultured Nocardioides sp.]